MRPDRIDLLKSCIEAKAEYFKLKWEQAHDEIVMLDIVISKSHNCDDGRLLGATSRSKFFGSCIGWDLQIVGSCLTGTGNPSWWWQGFPESRVVSA